MGVNTDRFPTDLESRISYIHGRIELYHSIKIEGFRTKLTGIIEGMRGDYPESEVQEAFKNFSDNIAGPYRRIDLKKLDDPTEFSFVYTTLDLIQLVEQRYQLCLKADNTSGFKDYWRKIMSQEVWAILSLGSIWENNLKIYQDELKKAVKQKTGKE